MGDLGMDNPLKPDVPGPTDKEIALQEKQEKALEKEAADRERAESKERLRVRNIKAGKVGLRSLLSGGFSGFKLGG